jgi:hypothetical protein
MQPNYTASGVAPRAGAIPLVAVTCPNGLSGFARLCAIFLSLMATCTSGWISIVAGWERGGQGPERAAWIFVGLVLLLSAHLIPALSRDSALPLRLTSLLLWAVAMVATGYTHATFFIAAQEHAGAARASQIVGAPALVSVEAPPTRTLDQIAIERALVERDLALANAQQCREKCPALGARRATLNARLTALNIEVDEARRRERSADEAREDRQHLAQMKTSAMADPVTYQLAALLKVSTGAVDLGMALSFGWLLEGVACLGWLLALPRKRSLEWNHDKVANAPEGTLPNKSNVTSDCSNGFSPQSNAVKAESNESKFRSDAVTHIVSREGESVSRDDTVDRTGASRSRIGGDESEIPPDLRRLLSAIERGETRRTVKDIRRYLRCSQEKAQSLRREIGNWEYMETAAR